MAEIKDSAFDPAQALADADIVAMVQNVEGTLASRRTTLAAIKAYIGTIEVPDRTAVTAVSSSAGVVTLDWSLGDYFTLQLTEDVTSWVISNPPADGKGMTLMVEITQDSVARTVAKPGTTPGGAALDVSTAAGAVDLLAISSFDAGATLRSNIAKGYA